MIKNIIIVILTFMVVVFWLKEEPEDTISNDPSDVVIEYNCNSLEEYENVPNEVVEECHDRGFSVKTKTKPVNSV